MENFTMVEMPLSPQTLRLIKSYAALSGKDIGAITTDLGDVLSDILDKKLKGMIAGEIGMEAAPAPARVTRELEYSTHVADLGDADDEALEPEDIPPTPIEEFRSGGLGLTDQQLDEDLAIDDPKKEAKAEPLNVPADADATEVFAEIIGDEDSRAQKRRKRYGTGKAKVKPMTPAVEAEGAGV